MDGTASSIQVEQKDSETYCQKSSAPLVVCTQVCFVCCLLCDLNNIPSLHGTINCNIEYNLSLIRQSYSCLINYS